ncbi:hypothetical protein [Sporosarcina cyprini]|uniref:hypothetical protein n=1 Tax=Sporosarcina cyprini TaxID=2910523 RepID=UPI001EDFD74B|nr:hypothetical protein [Sporosarcina cyprini]MCG3088462.1 hypothetical protein [Sporosarcina cyprini]
MTQLLTGIGCLLPIFAIGFSIYAFIKGFGFIGFLLSVFIFFIGLGFLGHSKSVEDRRIEKQKEILLSLNREIEDVEKMPTIVSSDVLTRLALDYEHNRVYVWIAEDDKGQPMKKPKMGMQYKMLTYLFSDLIAAAVVENRSVEMSTCKSVKEPLHTFIAKLPPIQMSEGQKNHVKLLELVIQLADEKYPFIPIRFFDEPYNPLSKKLPKYNVLLKDMHLWFADLEEIINHRGTSYEQLASGREASVLLKNELKEVASTPVKKEPEPQFMASVPLAKESVPQEVASKPLMRQPEPIETVSVPKEPVLRKMAINSLEKEVESQERTNVPRKREMDSHEVAIPHKTELDSQEIKKVEPLQEPVRREETVQMKAMGPTTPSVRTEEQEETKEEAELSYFERIVAENRRQLRGEPGKRK